MEYAANYGAQPRPITLVPFDQGWEPPTPAEIRAMLKRANLTGSSTAALLGIQSGRTIRRWTSEKDPVPIPYTAWAIICFEAGEGIIWGTKRPGAGR